MPLTTATMAVSAIITHCNTLPHTVTHCNICPNDGCFGSMSMCPTLQYTTMHYNASCFTLQRTATWCNALQQMPLPTAATADITLEDATFNGRYGATGYSMRKHIHKPHAHWHIFPPPPFLSYYPIFFRRDVWQRIRCGRIWNAQPQQRHHWLIATHEWVNDYMSLCGTGNILLEDVHTRWRIMKRATLTLNSLVDCNSDSDCKSDIMLSCWN